MQPDIFCGAPVSEIGGKGHQPWEQAGMLGYEGKGSMMWELHSPGAKFPHMEESMM